MKILLSQSIDLNLSKEKNHGRRNVQWNAGFGKLLKKEITQPF